MEKLGEDLLALIFDEIPDSDDRKSLSLVCKRWLKLEGITRSSLHVFDPDRLPNFLPRFPNLLKFRSSVEISNSLIQYVANSCPKIQVLNLNYHKESDAFVSINAGVDDFDDEGLCCITKRFPNLGTVLLRRRYGIGNAGVASLGEFSKKLKILDLGWCIRVSDEGLESIGGLHSLEVLNLQGCSLITDRGLAFLANGHVCNTLKSLNLAECDLITDGGVIHLRHMECLEELNLADCGLKVGDAGIGMGVAVIRALKKLNLSWLVCVSDESLVSLARCSLKLEMLNLTGCESVTAAGVGALSECEALRELVFACCDCNVTGDDLERVVFGCSSLEYVALDRRFRSWIPKTVQENILKKNCVLDWK